MAEVRAGHASAPVTSDPGAQATTLGAYATIRCVPGTHGPSTAVVTGELDLACADELAATLCAAVEDSAWGLRVDLAAVDFCDCAGLRSLVCAQNFAADCGRSFVLARSSLAVDRVLELTGACLPMAEAAPFPRRSLWHLKTRRVV